jgi:hypothetical protein
MQKYLNRSQRRNVIRANVCLWIACQDVLLPKGFGMKNKSQSWICSVYYHSKCCMEAEKRKNNISGRSPQEKGV